MANSYEKQLRLIGIPLFMVASWLGNQYYLRPLDWTLIEANLQSLVWVVLHWEVIRLILHFFRRRLPRHAQLVIRLSVTLLACGLAGMVVGGILFLLYQGLTGRETLLAVFAGQFGPSFFFSGLVVGAHEIMYTFGELRRMEREQEELKKAHLQSQLDSLKSQVNPHFLFNSLNSLLSLISTSPERAERFVEELSSVYRYLLQTNEKELSTLRQELGFLHSYFHLLKTRFGSGILLTLRIDPGLQEHRLPSLTLQLLIENAVKHNVISTSRPLTIELITEGGPAGGPPRLTVRNNLQRREQAVASSRMGLNNILSKFQLLNQADVSITDADGFFTVSLPLLNPLTA
ncbi:sensor histidine kinase [Larkinella soli]|uniref:sensor histidine kinase n=1 Tax=Larkinella soli TaxID=1770527 RepID=UPI000FFB3012|nr:histidine kinase [Larkinella soli]